MSTQRSLHHWLFLLIFFHPTYSLFTFYIDFHGGDNGICDVLLGTIRASGTESQCIRFIDDDEIVDVFGIGSMIITCETDKKYSLKWWQGDSNCSSVIPISIENQETDTCAPIQGSDDKFLHVRQCCCKPGKDWDTIVTIAIVSFVMAFLIIGGLYISQKRGYLRTFSRTVKNYFQAEDPNEVMSGDGYGGGAMSMTSVGSSASRRSAGSGSYGDSYGGGSGYTGSSGYTNSGGSGSGFSGSSYTRSSGSCYSNSQSGGSYASSGHGSRRGSGSRSGRSTSRSRSRSGGPRSSSRGSRRSH